MSTCVVRGAQVAPTPNLQHTYSTTHLRSTCPTRDVTIMIQSMLLIGTLRHLSSPASRLHAVSRIISICIFIVIIIMNNPFVGLNWNQRDMDAFIALVYLRQVLRRRRRRRRRYWVRPWLQRRPMFMYGQPF